MNRREFVKTTGLLSAIPLIETGDGDGAQKGRADRYPRLYFNADATGPMSWRLSRSLRHWLWLDDIILVVDDLLAHEAGRFDCLLHYAGKAAQNGSEIAITN